MQFYLIFLKYTALLEVSLTQKLVVICRSLRRWIQLTLKQYILVHISVINSYICSFCSCLLHIVGWCLHRFFFYSGYCLWPKANVEPVASSYIQEFDVFSFEHYVYHPYYSLNGQGLSTSASLLCTWDHVLFRQNDSKQNSKIYLTYISLTNRGNGAEFTQ